MGLVRGVTTAAPLVRQQVQIVEGTWPGPGEILAGRLAHSKLGCEQNSLAIGKEVEFDGRAWKISGVFAAGGAAYESELWCSLTDLQAALNKHYAGSEWVSVEPPTADGKLDALALNDTNRMELRVYANMEYQHAVLIARLDNLGKGASGAAVQNLKLMLGL